MTEYKVWAYARSAAPNLPALEEQLAEVMREADRICSPAQLGTIHIAGWFL